MHMFNWRKAKDVIFNKKTQIFNQLRKPRQFNLIYVCQNFANAETAATSVKS